MVIDCVGKSVLCMVKQFGFEQLFWQCVVVDCYEWFIMMWVGVVDCLGDDFFFGFVLVINQYVDI